MFARDGREKRTVIPRWRSSLQTRQSPESLSLKKQKNLKSFESWFEEALRDFNANPSPGTLADAFSAALGEGRFDDAKRLAASVIEYEDRMSPLAQKVALELLEKNGNGFKSPQDILKIQSITAYEPEVIHRYIAHQRRLLRFNDGNPFYWSDLAFAFNLLGQKDQAEKAIIVAVSLSNNHRVFLRAAARFYDHWRDTNSALRKIQQSTELKSDPWLLSAHIAISQSAGRASPYLGTARNLVKRATRLSIHYSELGMSLATEEYFSGNKKRSKILANKSIPTATENALAQGVWLSKQLDANINGLTSRLPTMEAYEANAWHYYYAGEWRNSLDFTLPWLLDQPFSPKPAMHGTFIAATFLQDFELACALANFGLSHNKNDWGLRNNLVVALFANNEAERASQEFSNLTRPGEDSENYSVWLATCGLREYRAGELGSAREHYKDSRRLFERKKDGFSLLINTLFQCREELSFGNYEYSRQLLMDAKSSPTLKTAEMGPVIQKILHVLEELNEQTKEPILPTN